MAKPLHHPDIDQVELTSVLDALSDPVRLRVVQKLHTEKELPCGSVCEEPTKSNLSYHYAKLREAGVTRTRIEGSYRYVSLRLDELEARFPGLMQSVLAAAERE